jgi:hypothetical protein
MGEPVGIREMSCEKNRFSPGFHLIVVFVLLRLPRYSSNIDTLGKKHRNGYRREIKMTPSRISQEREISTNRPGAFHCCIFCMPPTHYLEREGPRDNDSFRPDAQPLIPYSPDHESNMGIG